jgi:bifunctional UDP-N-acetylglucosamine pyrophosphorylase/glucosamine-1-phosphate N-acetyltransferase
VVRGRDAKVAMIVEEVDATDEERAIDEVATSVYCFRHSVLAPTLRRLSPDNAQGEYYLTDAIGVLHAAGYPLISMVVADPREVAGVNDRAQLAAAEAELRVRINERLMRRGVTMTDPEETYLDVSVEVAADVTLFPGVVLEGRTRVQSGAVIGPSVHLLDCLVGAGARVAHTVGQQAEIGEEAVVGPYAVLGPGTRLAPRSVTGPFFGGGERDG